MTEPVCAQRAPYAIDLDAGTYQWCACGKSRKQPFCDGSHQGTEFTPVMLELAKRTTVSFCGCKHTNTPPYCDGSHKNVAPWYPE